MNKIIAISGYAFSGKDTIGDYLVQRGFTKSSFAEPLRRAVARLNPIIGVTQFPDCVGLRYNDVVERYGYEEAKRQWPEVRNVLQRMGTEVGRNIFGSDIWVDLAFRDLPDTNIVFTDCRFQNEAAATRAAGGWVIRVEREGYGPVNDHPSETDLDDWEFDAVIQNNGSLDDLYAYVDGFLNDIGISSPELARG